MAFYPDQFFKKSNQKMAALTFGALGVVYGDIGTSPLYAINEIFFGHNYVISSKESILGPISLVIWALSIIISFKYLSLVLRADYDGEGGVFALYSRLHQFRNKYIYYLKILLILAAGLVVGEGIITPAISVLSAVEGLAIYSSNFSAQVIPITVSILALLFIVQKRGTHSLGKIFGSIAIFWFLVISFFGLTSVIGQPEILHAFNPYYALNFLIHISFHQALIVFGSVILVITGGEALFADMGHFGKLPIRLGWFLLVYPALLLSYLGQGAYLLSGQIVLNKNVFYSMIPREFLFPSVILATLATIIASQALISGTFSLAAQAVALGLFPRLKIRHTHQEHEGQIYVGFINWILFFGTITLVFLFKNSTSLAAAYGLSVSGVMLCTTLSMIAITHLVWKWNLRKSLLIFLPVLVLELSFVISNSVKFFEGGFIPFLIGVIIFVVMRTWKWGRKATYKAYSDFETMTIKEFIDLKSKQEKCMDKNVMLLVPRPLRSLDDKAPALLQLFYNRYGMFPKNIFLVEVIHRKIPYIHGPRHESYIFCKDNEKGTVASTAIHFGFMEEPNVELVLEDLALSHKVELPVDPHKWLVHTVQERLLPDNKMSLFADIRLRIFSLLRQITMPAFIYYGLGRDVNLSVEIMPIKLTNN